MLGKPPFGKPRGQRSEVRGLWVQNRTKPPLKTGSVVAGAVIHLSAFIPHEPLCFCLSEGIFRTLFPHGQGVFLHNQQFPSVYSDEILQRWCKTLRKSSRQRSTAPSAAASWGYEQQKHRGKERICITLSPNTHLCCVSLVQNRPDHTAQRFYFPEHKQAEKHRNTTKNKASVRLLGKRRAFFFFFNSSFNRTGV